jgi:phosphoglycerol transferase MdoB-like AlkP superfamily enzyme
MNFRNSRFAMLRPVLWVFLLGLLQLSLARVGLSLWKAAEVTAAQGWSQIFMSGLRVDVATMCMWLGLVAALYLLLPSKLARSRPAQWLLAIWLTAALAVPFMLEVATPVFMSEYGLRPNRLFIEYLVYPEEVGKTLLEGHLIAVLVATLLDGLVIWLAWRWIRRGLAANPPQSGGWLWRVPLAFVVVLLSALGVRSTLGHRPMNPAMVAFSSNATVNALPLNSFYSVAHATRDWFRRDPGSRIYDESTSDESVAAAMRAQAVAAGGEVVASEVPVLLRRAPVYAGKPRNLVIVLEESLGAQFIGSLGGRPLSPNFDRLAQQGWAFDRLYATGTRSVRGIEAVVGGFTPTPSLASVKLPKAQQDFYTLATTLHRHGYDTTFYYGGESHFDNMRSYFLGNGFTRVIEEKDYENPILLGPWGVSDEDLFLRADAEFRRMHDEGKPFFGFVFTSSNHDPFAFPDGRIELYEQPKNTRDNAAKYADYALGEFFKRAMASDYWADTVFLVVADHDSRVLGQSLVPVDNFHIPGLILGPGIEPRRDARLVSQIDLPVTLLSLIGIADPTPMVGEDLNRADAGGRAFMQYDNNYALMTDDAVVILQPEQPPAQFRYEPGKPLVPMPAPSPEQVQRARVNALWGTVSYQRQWHRSPRATSSSAL